MPFLPYTQVHLLCTLSFAHGKCYRPPCLLPGTSKVLCNQVQIPLGRMQYFTRLTEGFCARPIWKRGKKKKSDWFIVFCRAELEMCKLLNLPQPVGAAVGTGTLLRCGLRPLIKMPISKALPELVTLSENLCLHKQTEKQYIFCFSVLADTF